MLVPLLLPPMLDPSLLYIRSTDIQRTVLSAYNLLDGLYCDSPELVGSKKNTKNRKKKCLSLFCLFSKVTVNIADEDTDETTGGNTRLCPILSKL
jgi:hypothetical protein